MSVISFARCDSTRESDCADDEEFQEYFSHLAFFIYTIEPYFDYSLNYSPVKYALTK